MSDGEVTELDAAAQKALLALMQKRGNAAHAVAKFAPFGAFVLYRLEACGDEEIAARDDLLAQAIQSRHPQWPTSAMRAQEQKAQQTSLERASALPMSKSGRRQAAIFAAKIAQATLKTYTGAIDKANESETMTAMDLACAALHVASNLERDARLGDLVLDNLLYQLAKKYSEIQAAPAQRSAAYVLGCVHTRLWNFHGALCASNGFVNDDGNSRVPEPLGGSACAPVAIGPLLPRVAVFPQPRQFHSAQYTRLLLGVANTCVTILFNLKQYEIVFAAADGSISRWISHLDPAVPQDAKLAASLNDRTFRVLWKCASAVESSAQSQDNLSSSLRFRTLALSYMTNCPNYQPCNIIQQVHRTGVQLERISQRSPEDYKLIREFYMQSAVVLSHKFPGSKRMYEATKLDWDYLMWTEHFATVCDHSGTTFDGLMLWENAVHYVWRLGDLGQAVGRSICCAIACGLLTLAHQLHSNQLQDPAMVCDERLQNLASQKFLELTEGFSSGAKSNNLEKAARMYLKKTEMGEPCSSPEMEVHAKQLIPFLARFLKKCCAGLYNYAMSNESSSRRQLHHQIVASFEHFCVLLLKLRSDLKLDGKLVEIAMLTESRLHRMALGVSIHDYKGVSDAQQDLRISRRVAGVQELLDHALTLENKTVQQGILADLNIIARECYACGARFYKTQNYRATITVLMGSFELAETFLEYVMCADMNDQDVAKFHRQLKLDAIVSLLAFCYHEVGDAKRAREFAGHSILYSFDPSSVPHSSAEKYVATMLKEREVLGDECGGSLTAAFRDYLDGVLSAFKVRGVRDDQLVAFLKMFRWSFEGASSRDMARIRAGTGSDQDAIHAVSRIRLCAECEQILDVALVRLKITEQNARYTDALVGICSAVTDRKVMYSAYFVERDHQQILDGLYRSCSMLSECIDSLRESDLAVEIGVAYGWRGVINMEAVLVSSYTSVKSGELVASELTIAPTEMDILGDFESCMKQLAAEAMNSGIFEPEQIVCCLEAVCETLTLTSCPTVEVAARSLLQDLQRGIGTDNYGVTIGPPPPFDWLQKQSRADQDEDMMDDDVDVDKLDISKLFQIADGELSRFMGVRHDQRQANQHLVRAAEALAAINAKVKLDRSSPEIAKAVGVRQMLLHIVLSEMCFIGGKMDSALAELKAALAICWKLSRKFASNSDVDGSYHFKLPSEIGDSNGGESRAALLYFKAIEFSSWDILNGAKIALCRIALLYSYAGQPRRAITYYTEAMKLVGGLNLRLFDRDPFCRYAQLQLESSRIPQAKLALDLLPNHLSAHLASIDVPHSQSRLESGPRFLRQQCAELVQDGDLKVADGDRRGASVAYSAAAKLLAEVDESGLCLPFLHDMRARCWRKIARLLAEDVVLEDDAEAWTALMETLGSLESAVAQCLNPLEQVKCMLELGRQQLCLLRRYPARVPFSLEKTTSMLETAFTRGDQFGISHLAKELRSVLASAYIMRFEEIETSDRWLSSHDTKQLGRFLAWSSAVFLGNSSTVESKCDTTFVSSNDSTAGEHFAERLGELSVSSQRSLEQTARETIHEQIEDAARQVMNLPAHWLTVSVSINSTSELLVTRIEASEIPPATFCLSSVEWKKAVESLSAIVEESRLTLSGHSVEEAGAWSSEQKKQWWDKRKELDKRMEAAVSAMQASFGFWRCLFIKGTSTPTSTIVQQCWSLLDLTGEHSSFQNDRHLTLLCAVVDALPWLSDDDVSQALTYIAGDNSIAKSKLTPVVQLLQKERLRLGGCSGKNDAREDATMSPLAAISRSAIPNLKVVQIKELLVNAGLSTEGLKKDLVDRLLSAHDALHSSRHATDAHSGDSERGYSDGATILILDQRLQEFPWEGIDVMSACGSVTRMPSLELLLKNASQAVDSTDAISTCKIRPDRVRYLLNPAGDLKATQKHLGPVLQQGTAAFGWEGVVGSIPDADEFRRVLSESDLFIYCGHGSGEKYLHRDKILSIRSGCSAALLFGCSSGRLETEGIYGPNGTVLSYLRAGSPCVLAMLWDVTDKDIDQFSVRVLQQWLLASSDGGGQSGVSLSSVVQSARAVCKLRYLNGHAAVCYGLPLCVFKSTA